MFGKPRPAKPDPPGPGQRSVWDFPRPPAIEPEPRKIRVIFNGTEIVRTSAAYRVMETSHPYVFFIPPGDIAENALQPVPGRRSMCEWKGQARYFDVVVGDRIADSAAFAYDDPVPAFRAIAGYPSIYAGAMDACFVGDERVTPQPGGFYSGWITSDVTGPFKGGPGTMGW